MLLWHLLLFPCTLIAQDILWEKSYGGIHAEYLLDAQPTADYGFILAGSSLSGKTGNKNQPNAGDMDYWVWKMDESGELDWQKSFGGSGSDLLQSIRLTNDGGFILGGVSNSPNGKQKNDDCRGGDDFWVIKLDAKGGEQWQRTIGGNGQEKLQSVIPTKDGGYVLGGTSSSGQSHEKTQDSFGNVDYWVVKLNKDGEIEWQQAFGGIYLDNLRSIEQTQDNGYIVGGYSNSTATGNKSDKNSGSGDFWVLKLDNKGEIQWQKTLGGSQDDQLYVVHQAYDGNYLVAGNSNSMVSNNKTAGNSNGADFWVIKLDTDGNNIWQETYNIGKADILTSLVENKDHTLLLAGFAQTEISGTQKKKDDRDINDYVVIKTNERGEEIWRKSIGSDGEDILKKAIETRDGGYLLAGMSNPTQSGNPSQKNTSSKTAPVTAGNNNNKSNKQSQNAADTFNESMKELTDEANQALREQTGKLTKEINDAIGPDKDSGLQYGLNAPNSSIKNPMQTGTGDAKGIENLLAGQGRGPILPASREKSKSYGKKDFWVVKLKDKDKPQNAKSTIEAIPNPANSFTNIIVGYDVQGGTATVVDLAGHVLDSVQVMGRTVPIDMSSYPEGIYIVNIKTEKGTEGVKVIKNNN